MADLGPPKRQNSASSHQTVRVLDHCEVAHCDWRVSMVDSLMLSGPLLYLIVGLMDLISYHP